MRIKTLFALFSLLLIMQLNAQAAGISPDEIVAKADEVRSPQLDYTVEVNITSVIPDGDRKTASYEVLIKGRDKTIVKTMAPELERGRTLLMLGTDLWAFMPDVSKPIRISLQQRLIGEVANGDIARANFSGDYKAKLVKTEKIGNREYYLLELIAISEEVTYNKVVYWVDKANYRPLKAEFYAISGRLLKTCSYEEYRELAGMKRPSRLVLSDPLVKDRKSILEYGNMQVKNLPAKYFTKDFMKKIKY